jgi:hypothetical protein
LRLHRKFGGVEAGSRKSLPNNREPNSLQEPTRGHSLARHFLGSRTASSGVSPTCAWRPRAAERKNVERTRVPCESANAGAML